MSRSEWQANQELSGTPRRRINRDYASPVVPLSNALKVLGGFTAGMFIIASASEIWSWLSAFTDGIVQYLS